MNANRLLRKFTTENTSVSAASSTGNLLAVRNSKQQPDKSWIFFYQLFNTDNGSLIDYYQFQSKEQYISDQTLFSTTGHYYAVSSRDNKPHIVNIQNVPREVELALPYGSEIVAFTPDDSGILVLRQDTNGQLELWNLSTGKPRNLPKISLSYRSGIHFSPDGLLLGIHTYNGFELWDTTTWTQIATFSSDVSDIKFSTDGTTLALGSPYHLELWKVIRKN
jgi:WD40 repeat protein